jgi:phage tail sheath protein FI
MPVQTSYPGVYVEELPSSVRTVVGVGTSTTAFVGYTARGLDNRPARLFGFADYERAFGGLAADSLVSYAVSQYFLNGGTDAIVVRVPKSDATAASVLLQDTDDNTGVGTLRLTALSKGAWANDLLVDVDHDVPAGDPRAFNLTLTDLGTGAAERYRGVTLDATQPNFVVAVVNDEASGSRLVQASVPNNAGDRPHPTGTISGPLTGAVPNLTGKKLLVTVELSTTDTVPVTITIHDAASDGPHPSSLAGVCALIERKVNLAIPSTHPGIRVRCQPIGDSVRLQAAVDFGLRPDDVDAPVRVTAPANNSALALLAFDSASDPTTNVSWYRLGVGRDTDAQVIAASDEGLDGVQLPQTADLIGSAAAFTGMHALDRVDLFNLLCIPDATRTEPGNPLAPDATVDTNAVLAAAYSLCERRRALLLVDPPADVRTLEAAVDWISAGLTVKGPNAAAYFPRTRVADPLDDFRLRPLPPSGGLAGRLARIDSQRGVWKAAAGTEAALRNVAQLEYRLNDAENGVLNPLGLNCLRTKPVYGTIAWGARTLDGADALASQWKYLPVRRLALMIEESLFRGTQWAVFEPNDETLWGQLRLNVQSFMQGLFRQGAFQGTKPADAYLVKCDAQTTTQDDVDRGIVNILVGFAPLKPAEFVIIRIQQLAGESPA